MAAPTHDCPGGCGAQVRREHFACPADWARLPDHLRQAVSLGYEAEPLGTDHTQAMVDAMDWYLTEGEQ